jgi:precorrin-3B C17-methyltransferase
MARRAIEEARTVVGYGTYLDLVPPELLEGKDVIQTGMTGEVARCERAVDRALSGEDTVVVSGGDAGVYGMAGLVLEILEARGLAGTVDFSVIPGIPALAGAAALLGAPLTHDFACVSLSDLLTPWEVIERRLDLAAQADFVLVVYNPRSKKRAGHLARAVEIVGRWRGPDTPVGVVRQAYRPGQEVFVTTLAGFDPDRADMLTIVVVGNAASRIVSGRMLTPRGYEKKYSLSG